MFTQKLFKGKKLLLGSKSKRRKLLLEQMDLTFELILKEIDESIPNDMSMCQIPSYISNLKSDSIDISLKNKILITADTLVKIDNTLLGKPYDVNDAIRMLSCLSGRSHEVITAVTLRSDNKRVTFSESTIVHFNYLDQEDIRYYIEKYRPFDKAGGYGIQDWIGKIGIYRIEGCFYNVVGLPISRLYQELKQF